MRDALLRFEHPEGLRFQPTDEPDELLAELSLYDVKYRGLFLWFVPIESYDVYRMRVRIDSPRKTVLVQDERETYLKSWTRLRHEFFKGVYKFCREKDKLWGRHADGSLGELYRYSFDSEKLKEPIRKLVSDAGWTLDEIQFA